MHDDDVYDAFRYLTQSFCYDMEYDPSTLDLPLTGLSKMLEEGTVRMADPYFAYVGVDFGYLESTQCSHEWIFYSGLSESYNYCKKCDVKSEN